MLITFYHAPVGLLCYHYYGIGESKFLNVQYCRGSLQEQAQPKDGVCLWSVGNQNLRRGPGALYLLCLLLPPDLLFLGPPDESPTGHMCPLTPIAGAYAL